MVIAHCNERWSKNDLLSCVNWRSPHHRAPVDRYEDAVFHVTAMGFPPAELAANSRAYFGNINFFGGPHEHSVRSRSRKCSRVLTKLKRNFRCGRTRSSFSSRRTTPSPCSSFSPTCGWTAPTSWGASTSSSPATRPCRRPASSSWATSCPPRTAAGEFRRMD